MIAPVAILSPPTIFLLLLPSGLLHFSKTQILLDSSIDVELLLYTTTPEPFEPFISFYFGTFVNFFPSFLFFPHFDLSFSQSVYPSFASLLICLLLSSPFLHPPLSFFLYLIVFYFIFYFYFFFSHPLYISSYAS